MLVMGCNDASMFDNALVGQPQSNLWFITPDQLDDFGPKIGFGGPWINEAVRALDPSVPFLISGFNQIMVFAETTQQEVRVSIEKRVRGQSNWESWGEIKLTCGIPQYLIHHNSGNDEWVRFTADQDVDSLTVVMHLTPSGYPEKSDHLFRSLQPRGSADIKMGWLRPDGESGDLQIFSLSKDYANLSADLTFVEGEMGEELTAIRDRLIPVAGPLSFDSASVIYTDEAGKRWRLPYGYPDPGDHYHELNPRMIREVATERSLMNTGGLFYELPRDISGGISKSQVFARDDKSPIQHYYSSSKPN